MKASIFIPTKNAGNGFRETLRAIYHQSEKDFEVIIVDSGSTDQTLNIIKSFPAIRLYQIPPEEFGHGKTRNLALKYAKGEFIVFLTQDAIPANRHWLENILRNFNNLEIVGVYSRQVPYPNTPYEEQFYLNTHFNNKTIIRKGIGHGSLFDIFFSNVSSGVRKDIFHRFPFNEDIIMSEDQEWSQRVLSAGHMTQYDPESIVIHSHNLSFISTFRRYSESAESMRQILGIKILRVLLKSPKYQITILWHLILNKPNELQRFMTNNTARIIGTLVGVLGISKRKHHPK